MSTPTTCCMVGLFSGEWAVQRSPTCRHSSASRSVLLVSVSVSSLSLASTIFAPFLFRITPRAQLTVASSHFACPVTSSNTRTPNPYTSPSGVSLLPGCTKSEIRGSRSSPRRMLVGTRWPCTIGRPDDPWCRNASPRAIPSISWYRVGQSPMGLLEVSSVASHVGSMMMPDSWMSMLPAGSSWSHRCRSPFSVYSYSRSFCVPAMQ